MKYQIPEAFFKGKIAIRCGEHAKEFWNEIAECIGKTPVDDSWQKMAYEKFQEDLSIGYNTKYKALGWCTTDWYVRNHHDILDINDIIIDPQQQILEVNDFLDLI